MYLQMSVVKTIKKKIHQFCKFYLLILQLHLILSQNYRIFNRAHKKIKKIIIQ